MQKIVTVPNAILRKKSKLITSLDKKTNDIINQLETTLTQGEIGRSVGLSAVQISKPIRVLSTFLPKSGNPDDKQYNPILTTFINPEITSTSKQKTLGPDKKKPYLEGCLSLPGIWGPIYRYEWIQLKWQSKDEKLHIQKFKDFPSRVIQHEFDHLNGILFTDHSLHDKLPLYEYQNDKLIEISL